MPSPLDVGPHLPDTFKDLLGAGGVRQNAFTHEWNRNGAGNNGTSTASKFRTGRIVAPVKDGDTAINRFFFHYNPQSVSLNQEVNPDIRDATQMAVPTGFSDVKTSEVLTFDFLLNRMYDVALHKDNYNDSAKAYGTLHDLYYLYGLINRNFDDASNGDNDYPNTDIGLISPNPVTVIFGELFRFVGVIQSIGIQHAKFIASPLSSDTSAPLIPVLTNVSLSLKRTPGAYADTSTDTTGGVGQEPGQTKTPTTSLPGPGHGSPGDTTTPATEQPGA